MNLKQGILFLSFLVSFSAVSSAQVSDLIYTGEAPQANSSLQALDQNDVVHGRGRDQIMRILEIETRVATVNEALDLKRQGLQYVTNLSDFELLSSCPFPSPSVNYVAAVGDFISQNVANYVRSASDIRLLNILEARVPQVNQAIAVKKAGLRARLSINDFVQLIPPSVQNPSPGYVSAISTFVAQNVSQVLNSQSPIYMIVRAEVYATTVSDAMTVKRAGLVAVHTQRQLIDLATYSVATPSENYKQAVNDFLRANITKYP